jgi:hypothetical protein
MPVEEIRLQRTHFTEETARVAVLNDLAAFKQEFPGVIIPTNSDIVRMGDVTYPENREYGEYVMRERYADYGLVACMLFIRVDFEKVPRDKVGEWLDQLYQAKEIDCGPSL